MDTIIPIVRKPRISAIFCIYLLTTTQNLSVASVKVEYKSFGLSQQLTSNLHRDNE
jgi:hypothetical protein